MNGNSGSSGENNSNSGNSSISWGTKAKYIGAGIVIGTMISPFLKRALSKVQPKVDELFDHLTGKTEEFAERTSDLLARAKQQLHSVQRTEDPTEGHREASEHPAHEPFSNGTSARE